MYPRISLLSLTVSACIIAGIIKFIVLLIYIPLQVDGGWAGYSAVALSRGGNATENTKSLSDLAITDGLSVKHGYDGRSIRLLPMAIWFRVFGYGFWSTRAYSFCEYIFLMLASYAFFRRISNKRELALIFLCIYLTDKCATWMIADLRPDIMMAALGLFGFILFQRSEGAISKPSFLFSTVLLTTMALVWHSSPIVLAVIFAYFGAELFFFRSNKIFDKDKIISYLLLLAVPTVAFFLRKTINNILFGEFMGENLSAIEIICSLWRGGVKGIIFKEIVRWSNYYLNSNIVLFLAAVVIPFITFFWSLFAARKRCPKYFSLIFGIIAGLLVLLIMDPHLTHFHLLGITPFLLGSSLLSLKMLSDSGKKIIPFIQIIGLACACISIIFSLHTAINYEKIGFNNEAVLEIIKKIMPKNSERFFAIGPTELFPYIQPKGTLIIMDNRTGSQLKEIDPYIFKYIFVNKEYELFGYLKRFKKEFPGVQLVKMGELGNAINGPESLNIYEVKKLDLDLK